MESERISPMILPRFRRNEKKSRKIGGRDG